MKKPIIAAVLTTVLLLAGCSAKNNGDNSPQKSESTIISETSATVNEADIPRDNDTGNADVHTMLVFFGGDHLYDLESGEIFGSHEICKEYQLNEGDVVKLGCVITKGNSEIAGNYSEITNVSSCKKTSLSDSDAKYADAARSGTVGVQNDGIIDITDPSNCSRTIVYAEASGFGAVSDEWEGAKHFDEIREIMTAEETTALVCANKDLDDGYIKEALKNGNCRSDNGILFAGYTNDLLMNCETVYFGETDNPTAETAGYVFNDAESSDDMREQLKEDGFSTEVIDKISSMDLYDDKTVYVFCGEFSIDPKQPVVIDCNNRIVPSNGDEKAVIVAAAVDNSVFESVAR